VEDGKLWVIKQVNLSTKSEKEKEAFRQELKILESLNHPNIVKFKEVYATLKGKVCLVMEYADGKISAVLFTIGGDLSVYIQQQSSGALAESKVVELLY